MKLSISNIAWDEKYDQDVYRLMNKYGYTGLEIAPSKIFYENPYDRLDEAEEWCRRLRSQYGCVVSSMQSIWYGRKENMFNSAEERKTLIQYTKKAILFAERIGCNNLVFGCPRNRSIGEKNDSSTAVSFFKELGEYAYEHHTAIGMEANPVIYNTDFVNDTKSAFELIHKVNSQGFKLNLDVGTIIENEEDINELKDNVNLINHVHISEPGLKKIIKRELHNKLLNMLVAKGYNGFVSIEMGRQDDLDIIRESMEYLKGIFR